MSYHMHECTTILCHDSSQLSVRGIFDNRDRKVAALQHCLQHLRCCFISYYHTFLQPLSWCSGAVAVMINLVLAVWLNVHGRHSSFGAWSHGLSSRLLSNTV